MALRYPVASTAEAALHAPLGEAERESEARRLAQAPVAFSTEFVGPAFATPDAALAAYAGRSGGGEAGLPPWCALRPVAAPGARPRPPLRPANRDGVRWPAPDAAAPAALWRLAVTWWRSAPLDADAGPLEPARALRRGAEGAGLSAEALRRLLDQPLRPARTQRALDTGLFEAARPEAPGLVIPDE